MKRFEKQAEKYIERLQQAVKDAIPLEDRLGWTFNLPEFNTIVQEAMQEGYDEGRQEVWEEQAGASL